MTAGLAAKPRVLLLIGLLLVAMVSPAAAQGRLQGEVQGGTLKPIPIAIPEFLGDDPRFALEVSNIVSADLERSGLFQPLDRAAFIDSVRDMNAPPRFPDWRAINAQGLVVGRAFRGPDGRLVAETRVWDVFSTRQLGSQRFTVAVRPDSQSAPRCQLCAYPPIVRISSSRGSAAKIGARQVSAHSRRGGRSPPLASWPGKHDAIGTIATRAGS